MTYRDEFAAYLYVAVADRPFRGDWVTVVRSFLSRRSRAPALRHRSAPLHGRDDRRLHGARRHTDRGMGSTALSMVLGTPAAGDRRQRSCAGSILRHAHHADAAPPHRHFTAAGPALLA